MHCPQHRAKPVHVSLGVSKQCRKFGVNVDRSDIIGACDDGLVSIEFGNVRIHFASLPGDGG